MGIAERKERQKAEVREQILEAARVIVGRDGFEGLTMRKIAEAIEYSPAAIYSYFESREEIGRQLVREGFAELLRYMAAAGTIEDPLERLRAIGSAYVRFGLECPEQYRLAFMTDERYAQAIFPEEHKGDPSEPGYRAFAFLTETVAAAQAAGTVEPRDPLVVAEMLWASVHGLVALGLTCRSALDTDIDVLAETLLDVVTNGLKGAKAAP